MVATVNISLSYLYTPNREVITICDKDGINQGTVQDAKRLMEDAAEQEPSFGEYLANHCDWRLPSVQVSCDILPGWKIIDSDGNTYIVQDVDPPSTYGATWTCYCRRLFLLGHTVQYIRMVSASSPTGSRTATATPTGDPMPCAIQPISRAISDEFGAKAVPQTYMIWLYNGVGMDILAGDMFSDENGRLYEITEVSDRRRIDALSRFTCVVKL